MSFRRIDIIIGSATLTSMATKASTHRLEPAVQAALDRLSKHLRRPKNRLINDAVKFYIRHKSPEIEEELEETLSALRAYRLRDPDFEDSIQAFVDAEAQLARGASAEGKLRTGAITAEPTPDKTAAPGSMHSCR